ncbi:uncharacterized protein LOC105690152 [Athalia rosae]|uniref:uncharacterized protein LOC105690152 n=1 Tax=Athalia rosae TaxID=37344 RepID=UPI0020347D2C|nr:uncharacterized protein LOC105690152 [Athalia rosae]
MNSNNYLPIKSEELVKNITNESVGSDAVGGKEPPFLKQTHIEPEELPLNKNVLENLENYKDYAEIVPTKSIEREVSMPQLPNLLDKLQPDDNPKSKSSGTVAGTSSTDDPQHNRTATEADRSLTQLSVTGIFHDLKSKLIALMNKLTRTH